MPILWRYLLKGYFQLFSLCLSAFVAILLVVRFQEIAVFASSGAKAYQIALFSLYQVPYILPIAIPISCLLASFILFQRMSSHMETTAFRASGMSLKTLAYPLLLGGFVLSLANLSIASEMTPFTRSLAKHLLYKIARDNPLIVMQKDSIVSMKSFDFDLKNLDPGKKAEEVIGIMRQDSQERISLFTAKELSVNQSTISGEGISFISSVPPHFPGYDHLIIENQGQMQIDKLKITSHLFNKEWFAKDDLLTLKEVVKKHKTSSRFFTSKMGIELLRRASFALCPLTFTFMGIAFGVHIGRSKRKGNILYASALAFFVLGSFVAAKTLQKAPSFAALLYLLPHPIACLVSFRSLKLTSQGVSQC